MFLKLHEYLPTCSCSTHTRCPYSVSHVSCSRLHKCHLFLKENKVRVRTKTHRGAAEWGSQFRLEELGTVLVLVLIVFLQMWDWSLQIIVSLFLSISSWVRILFYCRFLFPFSCHCHWLLLLTDVESQSFSCLNIHTLLFGFFLFIAFFSLISVW